jgi:nucleoside-diphosphate-sugar epimerase
MSDGMIHAAFIHDFSNFKAVCEIDRQAIEALGTALAGSDRALIVTSGASFITPGRIATEEDLPASSSSDFPRIAAEEAAAAVEARGAHIAVVRLAVVHGDGDPHFLPSLIGLARATGVSAYIGDGLNRWPAVHRLDAARLYRLALEQGAAGARYHGVAEEGVPFRDIAGVIGRRLNLPVVSTSGEEAAQHFGGFALFAGMNGPASSTRTQELLGWQPKQLGLLPDLDRPRYFQIGAGCTGGLTETCVGHEIAPG